MDLLADLLPRKVVRVVGVVLPLALFGTGTFQAAFAWYVEDKHAALMEDVVGPVMQRLTEDLSDSTAPGAP
ncbi:hypothetical protein GXB85_13510 [Cellulomonas sp. APG4]|uniref:hypothetical protein n=1 Tax=Cellulomonas sp. APG4 TaxID=1538656 RepID=UPI00137A937F|nr:hypothetical protein [Cellulomonas sp. APG4]NCT91959.1 hypothetical protein [Cellulomonas sp. APG4]